MKKSLCVSLVIVLGLSPTSAQSVFPFLRHAIPARVAALGGSFVAMQDDPDLLFVNPAGLATVSDGRASLSYLDHLLDISAGSLSYTTLVEPVGPVGIGVIYYSYGEFDRTDASLNTSGTFSASDIALVAGVGHRIDDALTAGVSAKFIHSSIGEYASSALAVDAGVLYTVPEERLALGASVLNLGRQLTTYDGVNEDLPLDVTIGVAKRPEHLPVWLNLNFHRLTARGLDLAGRIKQYSFGAEFEMSPSLRIRLGYDNTLRRDLRFGTSAGLAGFSGGLGLTIKGYVVNYAYNSYGSIGGLHRFGIATQF